MPRCANRPSRGIALLHSRPMREAPNAAAAAPLRYRHSPERLHELRGAQALHIAVQPLRRREGAGGGAWHQDLQPLQQGHQPHERRRGVPGLRASGGGAGGPSGRPLHAARHFPGAHVREHAALRVRRARVHQLSAGARRLVVRLQPARDAHERDHRRRAHVQKRHRHPLPEPLQRDRHPQAPGGRLPRLHVALPRATARLRARRASPRVEAHGHGRGPCAVRALRLRAGCGGLTLPFRGAARRPTARAPHNRERPRHHDGDPQPLRRLPDIHGRALRRDVQRHRVHPHQDGRGHERGLHHPQPAPPERPCPRLHPRARAAHREL